MARKEGAAPEHETFPAVRPDGREKSAAKGRKPGQAVSPFPPQNAGRERVFFGNSAGKNSEAVCGKNSGAGRIFCLKAGKTVDKRGETAL